MDEDGEWFGIIIELPYPLKMPLCYEIYLFFDKNFMRKGCFTLEYDKVERKKTTRVKDKKGRVKKQITITEEECGFICSWTEDHGHLNHGSYFMDEDVDFFTEAFNIHLQNSQAN